MFRLFATDDDFSFHGVFWSYGDAQDALADAEEEYPDTDFEVQELVKLSDDTSEWQVATDPEGE